MKKIIMDCDPGHDDALALMLALASKDALEVLAVTASAGNQTLEKTSGNIRRLLTLMNRLDIPVAKGSPHPICRPLETAASVHGESGLEGAVLPEAKVPLQEETAIALMARVLRKSSDKVTLVVTGPMTNAALFLRVYPELKEKIERIVFMGGSVTLGNWSPSAEFNIFVDAEAAKIVLASGLPITMVPLDVTHKAQILDDEILQAHAIDNPVAKVYAGLLDFFRIYHKDPKWGFQGAPLHDVCTIAWLTHPEMFTGKELFVDVETQSPLTYGETVADYYDIWGKKPNCLVLLDVDRPAFITLLLKALRTF